MSTARAAAATLPRGSLVARAWAGLGDAVAPLSNPAGRPLTRTVKLILDPLVLRPVLNPEFAAGAVAAEHADALVSRIADAGPVLAATASWFVVLKKERRRRWITDGNPQDLYFQRCFELATAHGEPGPDAADVAAAVLEEVHEREGPTVAALRDHLTDPVNAGELTELLEVTWAAARPFAPASSAAASSAPTATARFLATCAVTPDRDLFHALVTGLAGTAGATDHDRPGVALAQGLTARDVPARPELGRAASKANLPRPFDRSILERLFAPLTNAFQRAGLADVPTLVRREITRSAEPWQLADEESRLVLVMGRDASADLAGASAGQPGSAAARLRSRWEREAYVHRVLRMSTAVPPEVRADVRGVREAYLRRLWVRLHGRELRRETVTFDQVWDVLDGVLRSVILDQRDRLRSVLEREAVA
ncbi:alginate export family protein [Saccharothrix stipae]